MERRLRPSPARGEAAALACIVALLLLVPTVASPKAGSGPAGGTGGTVGSRFELGLPPGPSPGVVRKNVSFTGNLTTDFGAPYSVNRNASLWGPLNNLSAVYVAVNSTELFLGLREVVTGNSLMVFVGNGVNSGGIGTYNLSGLNAWGRSLGFTSSIVDLAAVYFGSTNANRSGYGAFQVDTPPSDSNSTPSVRSIASTSFFDGALDASEIALPLTSLFPVSNDPWGNLTLSAFVVGNTGSWVGTGIPYSQAGAYNAGSSQATFLVNDTLHIPLGGVPYDPARPLNVAIVFNDHQPLYQIAGQTDYNLPWTEAHATAEYIEQAVLLRQFPTVNITYELSGSLLYQLQNISHDPSYNDSFREAAWVPFSSLNTSANQSLLASLEGDWFSVPSYVFDLSEPASYLYGHLRWTWSNGTALTAPQYEDAKVLWFLYEISTDLVEGRLGASWTSPLIWALHNQTSFSDQDLRTVLSYADALTGDVIPAFNSIRWGNAQGSDNTELFTSPFYHPLTPLLLTPTISGPSGSISKGSYSSDVQAQINLSRYQFDQLFGVYPRGLYASEAAVSASMVEPIARSGAEWTATDEWTLQQSGVPAKAYGDPGWTVASMEQLYTPYVVLGANGTSTDILFRDAPLSNGWAFNYGNLPTATAIADIVNYLKGINASLPPGDHPGSLVTLMLDGENWQFMSPFADDGIPFLRGLYAALEANASAIHTVTPSQFLEGAREEGIALPVLGSLATGTWNQGSGQSAPFQSNPSLTQWSGYSAQDWMWVALDQAREKVVAFQTAHGLVQLENGSAFDANLTALTPEGNMTRAWYGIYNAEGSDWFFQMAPWTISGANTGPFNLTFQGDLRYALSQLNVTSSPPPPPPPVRVHLTFLVSPASCGSLGFNGTSWTNGSVGTFFRGNFTLQAPSCAGERFFNWTVAGGLALNSTLWESALVDLRGNGSIEADFRPVAPPPAPPSYVVTVVVSPTTCGPVVVNATNIPSGGTLPLRAGNFSLVAPACSGYQFQGWSTAGALSVSSSSATSTLRVQGNGTLTAAFSVLVSSPPPTTNPPSGSSSPSPWTGTAALEVVLAALVIAAGVFVTVLVLRRRSRARSLERGKAAPSRPSPSLAEKRTSSGRRSGESPPDAGTKGPGSDPVTRSR